MFIVPTVTKRGKKTSEGMAAGMAGAAKVPASAATASKEELKAMAAQMGWEIRELTFDEVQRMSSSELRFHELWNQNALDRAFSVEANKRNNREQMAIQSIRNSWERPTSEQIRVGHTAQAAFVSKFPEYDATPDNAQKLLKHMMEHEYDWQLPESYARSYRELVEAGSLTPKKPESADAYLSNHPEIRDDRVPLLIQARQAKAEATEKHFEKVRAATAKGTVVNVTDYPSEPSGYPSAPTKYSFHKLLDSLDAESYRKRINDDPEFAAAVDKFQNRNQ